MNLARDDHSQHSLLRPGVVIPFVLVALIWGSTWFAIKDGIGAVPVSWSVTWRFTLAAAGMFALALWRGEGVRLTGRGHLVALMLGVAQFCCNFNLVYRAEQYLTSGIVAVLFAMLMLPNALFAWIVFRQKATRGFLAGTAIALTGIVLLLIHEARLAPLGGEVSLGIAMSICAICVASFANVLQASPAARAQPMVTMLAWAMLWGACADFGFAWATSGPPVLPLDARYLGGVAYLALIGSVVTFPLYFQLIRELGPGRAAYNGVVVPIIAMGFSTVLEGYRWSLLAGSGAVLALIGLVVAMRARSPSR
ncbi:MAG: EamA family transporter [Candidatus Andeanibacterium colombiense]|uniref:EamA family transporter n=1 Tax=Candidatus Andeanibacterium colombiense TaxID=3121345 RepID=A0AAJ5X6R3_9SPHN|nr:MAG: EamA family transporter [Sphingomonadaceae bacterium]